MAINTNQPCHIWALIEFRDVIIVFYTLGGYLADHRLRPGTSWLTPNYFILFSGEIYFILWIMMILVWYGSQISLSSIFLSSLGFYIPGSDSFPGEYCGNDGLQIDPVQPDWWLWSREDVENEQTCTKKEEEPNCFRCWGIQNFVGYLCLICLLFLFLFSYFNFPSGKYVIRMLSEQPILRSIAPRLVNLCHVGILIVLVLIS